MEKTLQLCLLSALVIVACVLPAVLARDDGTLPNYGLNSPIKNKNNAPGYFMTDAVKYGATCIDGTPGAYYWEKGTGSGVNKWYLHHEGGGWCESHEDCYGRSLTDLGSSKRYPAVGNLGGGYLSDDPTINPMMYNWNKVYLKYCDGGSFSGNSSGVWGEHRLNYRGKLLLEAMRASLLSQGLREATDFVVSGCSAGGLATFLHVDWWRASVPASTHVVALPDSGFFLDYENPAVKPIGYHSGMIWVADNMNVYGGVNQKCVEFYTRSNEKWKCFFAQYTAPHITTPTFPLQSEFDSWQAGNVLGSNDVTLMNEFGKNLTTLVRVNLLQPLRANGVFLDSCFHHCGEWGSIRIDTQLQAGALQLWYNAPSTQRHDYIQDQPFPCDACCRP